MDEMLSRVSNSPEIIKVLRLYESNPERIKNIFLLLMMSGASKCGTWSVIENPKLLSQYLQMEADGSSPLEIAFKLAESIDTL